jgi:hypothetical protein
MKTTLLATALVALIGQSVLAASYNQNITAIFGGGNPDNGWTTDSGAGVTLGLRAKNRSTGAIVNVNEVYSYPVGTIPPANNRAKWNWEFSINSGAANLAVDYDYYVAVDVDPSQCVNYVVVDALANWSDNSYGNDGTLNGQGVEGTAGVPDGLASVYNIAQQSQNLVFAGGNPNIDATYNYELFAVAKGAGPNGARVASVGITVVVGLGGAPCDSDGDGIIDDLDACPHSDLSATVVIQGCDSGVPNTLFANGCTISDLIGHCAANAANHGKFVSCVAELTNTLKAEGAITAKQKGAIQSCAAKSSIGK